jgi:hypothetical protein
MELGRRLAQALERATFDRVAEIGLDNARINRPRLGRSILELSAEAVGEGDTAVVVGAGPSLARRDSLARLRGSGFRGAVVAADGALGACLRAGVVPDVVVSVDPHRERIVRWFGDPALQRPSDDDYFRRQELDHAHAEDELGANRTLLELVDRHGPAMRAAVATSAAPEVAERCAAAGLRCYWWNPMYDDYERPESVSARLHRDNGLPCINGGGNVGTAAWVIAHAILGKRRVALIGMDFGYPPGTPYERTQYYPELRAMLGERFAEGYVHLRNPHLGETWFCDPAYYWFRDVFLGMAAEAECRTYNCTEGGILFGEPLEFADLDTFLAKAAA